jgi:hypothetical protein
MNNFLSNRSPECKGQCLEPKAYLRAGKKSFHSKSNSFGQVIGCDGNDPRPVTLAEFESSNTSRGYASPVRQKSKLEIKIAQRVHPKIMIKKGKNCNKTLESALTDRKSDSKPV